MDDHDLTDRLRQLGTEPPPDDVRDRHLHRMADAAPAPAPRRFRRFAVAAAALVGFAFGSTGLAAAGALPGAAQDVAHDVLGAVSISVPEGTRGSCVSGVARSDMTKDEKQAAKAACPKGGPPGGTGDDGAPGRSGVAPGRSGVDKHADDPCRGKPPWAGNKALTAEEKATMQAERAACPSDEAETEAGTGDEPAG